MVLGQPSLSLPLGRAPMADLGVDDAGLVNVERRSPDGACLVVLGFSVDGLSPGEHFHGRRRELGDAFIAVEIDSSCGQLSGNKVEPLQS